MSLAFSDAAMRRFEKIVSRYPNKQAALLPVLHLAQEEFGYVPPEASAEPAEAAASDDVALPEERSGPLPTNEDEWKAEERRRILAALEAASWNRVKAAAKMGIPRRTFYRRLKEYGILE